MKATKWNSRLYIRAFQYKSKQGLHVKKPGFRLAMNMAFTRLKRCHHLAPQKGHYCLEATEWKLSRMCQMLGVLSVLSVQTSVMSLGVLSTYRMMIVVRPHSTDTTRYVTKATRANLQTDDLLNKI